jgi:hypothetical protein
MIVGTADERLTFLQVLGPNVPNSLRRFPLRAGMGGLTVRRWADEPVLVMNGDWIAALPLLSEHRSAPT